MGDIGGIELARLSSLRPVWVEIELENIRHNLRELRKLVGKDTVLMVVVKANGYGHGAVEIAGLALNHGASYLGVALLEEGIQLRRAGLGAPILILSYTPEESAEAVVRFGLSQTVYTMDLARALSRAAVAQRKNARVHVKVDTGMGRIGLRPEDVVGFVREIIGLPGIRLEGVFTHFAAAEKEDKSYTNAQMDKFTRVLENLEDKGIYVPLVHAANSAAVIDLPSTYFNMVRVGLALYGLYPAQTPSLRVNLKPAMAWKARISYLKTVPPGTSISYGCTYTTDREARIATLPLGYADGYRRALSNRAEVLVRGRRAKVVGSVCMDQMMVDVTDIPAVSMGDEVVLMGKQGEEEISAEELAGLLGTINYEVVTTVGGRVPRLYLDRGRPVLLVDSMGRNEI